MADKREWRGIQVNECQFIGRVMEEPVIHGGYAFLTLRTIITQQDKNGQITDVDQEIPIMVEPGSSYVRVVENYVTKGRQLRIIGQYKSWENQGKQHAFVPREINLGDKPYKAPQSGNNTPPLPS